MRISDWSSDVCSSDLPDLTLVGVVDADLGLGGGDLRASERTFQQIQQVAGRAGRGQKPGRVLLQKIGRTAGRERVGPAGYISVVAGALKKKNSTTIR